MKSLAVLVGVLFLSLAARADVSSEVVAGSPAARVARFLVVRTSVFSGVPDLIGASVAVRPFAAPLDVELGVGFMPFVSNAHLRVGPSIPLLDARDARGRGWELEVPLHAGVAVGLVGEQGTSLEAGLEIATGLDATFWLQARRGLNLRVLSGAGVIAGDFAPYPVASLTIGAAF
jgi:hypothetical protein